MEPQRKKSLVLVRVVLHVLLFFFVVVVGESSRFLHDGFRTHLTHVDSSGNYTKFEIFERSMKRDRHRLTTLLSRLITFPVEKDVVDDVSVEAPVHSGEGEFLVNLTIGTPGLSFSAIVDTGSDLIWTQCEPCDDCYDQPTKIFDPSLSSTFSNLPCSGELCKGLPSSECRGEDRQDCGYTYSYGDKSITKGVLASETFTIGNSSTSNTFTGIGFGCGHANSGIGFKQASGLVGLGRGQLSLISQLNLGKFSYCLTSYGDPVESPLIFGSSETLNQTSNIEVQTTPLVRNPSNPSFYYINLVGITVGSQRLTFPNSTFEINADGTGGFIVDSGTSITYLESDAYEEMKKAFLSKVKLPLADGLKRIGLDLCFSSSKSSDLDQLPRLIFHFDGAADMDIPPENYMIGDDTGALICLAMTKSSGISILGNFQQQNVHVLYDLENEVFSFVPTKCDLI